MAFLLDLQLSALLLLHVELRITTALKGLDLKEKKILLQNKMGQ